MLSEICRTNRCVKVWLYLASRCYPAADLCHCFRMRRRDSYYETSVSDCELSACLIRPAPSCCLQELVHVRAPVQQVRLAFATTSDDQVNISKLMTLSYMRWLPWSLTGLTRRDHEKCHRKAKTKPATPQRRPATCVAVDKRM